MPGRSASDLRDTDNLNPFAAIFLKQGTSTCCLLFVYPRFTPFTGRLLYHCSMQNPTIRPWQVYAAIILLAVMAMVLVWLYY